MEAPRSASDEEVVSRLWLAAAELPPLARVSLMKVDLCRRMSRKGLAVAAGEGFPGAAEIFSSKAYPRGAYIVVIHSADDPLVKGAPHHTQCPSAIAIVVLRCVRPQLRAQRPRALRGSMQCARPRLCGGGTSLLAHPE